MRVFAYLKTAKKIINLIAIPVYLTIIKLMLAMSFLLVK